jgi:hypothetical protein
MTTKVMIIKDNPSIQKNQLYYKKYLKIYTANLLFKLALKTDRSYWFWESPVLV